ncbi:MAG: hypothetical protein FJW20_09715 [Acidimicrobiia bacterium]|nr:hypothetical protein [Acidimicrobiia bacterium]
MLTSIVIIGISALMFCYWFRYTCSLILRTESGQDYTTEVAAANRLSFLSVRKELAEAPQEQLGELQSKLDRDFEIVKCLLRHSEALERSGSPEELMLRIDYQSLKMWCWIGRRLAPSSAKRALEEMSLIVGHFANSFAERAAATRA